MEKIVSPDFGAAKAKKSDRSSRMDFKKNEDGSIDIYCGPDKPSGYRSTFL